MPGCYRIVLYSMVPGKDIFSPGKPITQPYLIYIHEKTTAACNLDGGISRPER